MWFPCLLLSGAARHTRKLRFELYAPDDAAKDRAVRSSPLIRHNRGRAENSVDQSPETGAVPLPSNTESRNSGCNSREICVALSRVTEIGEQAAAAVAASIAGGGPVVRGQLIASRFYEAMQRELRQLPTHDPKRAALIAASDRCQRITAARINPSALLDELRKAIAVLRADTDASAPPTTARPLLRLIEGGLSKD
jgi:hypothetical protein